MKETHGGDDGNVDEEWRGEIGARPGLIARKTAIDLLRMSHSRFRSMGVNIIPIPLRISTTAIRLTHTTFQAKKSGEYIQSQPCGTMNFVPSTHRS